MSEEGEKLIAEAKRCNKSPKEIWDEVQALNDEVDWDLERMIGADSGGNDETSEVSEE